MKLETLFKIGILIGVLAAPYSHGQSFNMDGYITNEDSYTDKVAISFFNGHKPEAYGTANAPIYQTYVRWGVGKLSTDPGGADYFFMYVETPIEVKNMIWGNQVTADDIAEYNVQYSTHHSPMKARDFDYGKATGSEFIAFYDKKNREQLKSDLSDGGTDTSFGFIESKSSLDYLFSKGADTSSSGNASVDAHNIGMAFEYRFALNNPQNNKLLNVVRDGGIIEYHLSPERGLRPTQVPEPTSALMVMLGSAFLLRRRR